VSEQKGTAYSVQGTEQSRAEQSRAEQSRGEQNRLTACGTTGERMRVVLLSKYDCAGSGAKIRDAVRRHWERTKYEVRSTNEEQNEIILIKYRHDSFHGACDWVLSPEVRKPEELEVGYGEQKARRTEGEKGRRAEQRMPESLYNAMQKIALRTVQKILDEADIVHWKGDDLPSRPWYGLRINPRSKTIVTVGGSGFRRECAQPDSCKAKFPFEAYDVDLRTAITPDINYPEFCSIWTPHGIDSSKCEVRSAKYEVPIIAHSPSTRSKKGTVNIILPALEILKTLYKKPFEVDIIEKVSNRECVERKSRATIFIDNMYTNYANSGLEAMQFGIPTVSYMPDQIYDWMKPWADRKSCPVVNTEQTPEGLVQVLYKLLTNRNYYNSVAKKTKEYCDRVHSYEAVGANWAGIYQKLIANS
jgi:hypothetical protein